MMSISVLGPAASARSVWSAAEDIGKAGPIGLFLIVSLLVVVFFLGRSMRTHLRRVPFEFPDPAASAPPESPESATRDDRVIEGEILDPYEGRPGTAGRGPYRPDTPRPDLN